MTISSNIKVVLSSGSGAIQSSTPVTLRNTVNRLDTLADVVESNPANGHTLVYRSSDDKYVVQQLSLENVSGTLDGGSF